MIFLVNHIFSDFSDVPQHGVVANRQRELVHKIRGHHDRFRSSRINLRQMKAKAENKKLKISDNLHDTQFSHEIE